MNPTHCSCGWKIPEGVIAVSRETLDELLVQRRTEVEDSEVLDVPIIMRCPHCRRPHSFDPNIAEVLKQQRLVEHVRSGNRNPS